jgi:hypothetical protein
VNRLSYSTSASYRGNQGILKIENGNLIFVRRSGLVNQREYVVQSIPLGSIRSMDIQGTMRPMLVIVVDSSKVSGIPRHEFYVPAPGLLMSSIQSEAKKDGVQVSQSPQPTYVKEVVREIVKYPCPYCSSLIEVTSSRCSFCGAPQKK